VSVEGTSEEEQPGVGSGAEAAVEQLARTAD